MVSFDFRFISLLIKDIVEDDGALLNEGRISWLSVNRGSYQGKRLHVVYVYFIPFIRVS